MDPLHKTLTLTVPNGFLKKHYHHHQQLIVYRECLKNHAAILGGHSLDGCGEFMASPSSNPSDPTSLTCAACGCHRNFHRRLPHQHLPEEDDSEDGDDEDVGNYNGETSSAPHMLMALSAAVGTTAEEKVGPTGGRISRKRFRTRFSAEQKEGMLQLSERLGWRMQKKDDAVVEDRCRELGVGRGVFKVWMHNNKHNFVPSPRAPAVAVAVALPPPPPPPNVSSLALPTVSKGGGGDARVNGSGSAAMDTN